MSLINTQVQPFKAQAFHNGKFVEVTETNLQGKWSVIVFMPAAFTCNCPTEVEDAAENSPAVGKATFPLVGDPTHALTRAFDVHIDDEGLALRGTFIVNPDGVIKAYEIHDNAIARDMKEALRKLKAAKYVAEHPGEVCPAKWQQGAETLKPSLDLVGKI